MASATRCSTRAIDRRARRAPSGGSYRALIASCVRAAPSRATSRSASSGGNSASVPVAFHDIGSDVFAGKRCGWPIPISTSLSSRRVVDRRSRPRRAAALRVPRPRAPDPGSHVAGSASSAASTRVERVGELHEVADEHVAQIAAPGSAPDRGPLVPSSVGPLCRATSWASVETAVLPMKRLHAERPARRADPMEREASRAARSRATASRCSCAPVPRSPTTRAWAPEAADAHWPTEVSVVVLDMSLDSETMSMLGHSRRAPSALSGVRPIGSSPSVAAAAEVEPDRLIRLRRHPEAVTLLTAVWRLASPHDTGRSRVERASTLKEIASVSFHLWTG